MKTPRTNAITTLATYLSFFVILISCTGGTSREMFAQGDLQLPGNYLPGKNVSGKHIDRKTIDTALQTSAHIRQLLSDKNNYLWYGTYLHGFSVYTGEMQFRFETPTGTNGNIVRKMIETPDGDIWMATNYGLMHYRHTLPADMPDSYIRYTTKDGLPSNQLWSLCTDPKGGIWIGTESGLCHFDGKSFVTYLLPDAAAATAESYATKDAIMSLAMDAKGQLWMGTNGKGLYSCRPALLPKGFHKFTTEQGLCDNTIHCITIDKKGMLWIGTREGGLSRFDGTRFQTYNTTNGLSSNFIWTLCEDRFGQLWIGTAGGGALCFNGKVFSAFKEQQGLASNYVQSIIEDKEGHIWFGTGIGISRFSGNQPIVHPENGETPSDQKIKDQMETFPMPMDGC